MLNQSDNLFFAVEEYVRSSFTPHSGQIPIEQAIFDRNCKVVFLQCGRNFGKSHFASYICSKWAQLLPDQRVYYFAPLYKQVKDIVWYPRLIENLLLPELVESIDKQDSRYFLSNNSFIKLDGSDNYDSHRGYKPDLVIADEFAEFNPRWLEVMIPNLAARDATILFLGTPPRFPVLNDGSKHHYVVMKEECQAQMKQDAKRVFWIHRPTASNPHLPEGWVDRQKQILIERGEEYTARREYDAEIVMGDKSTIFPMFSESRHIVPHDELLSLIHQNPSKYEYWCSADPATRSVFAVNFFALDRYSGTPYWLDEIHQADALYTTASVMLPAIYEKCQEIQENIDEWNFVCDNAAASFILEASESPDYPIYFMPTEKKSQDKFEYISVLKDIFRLHEGVMSDRCFHTQTEIINYVTDPKGRIVKAHDHHIDNSRYVLKTSAFSLNTSPEPKKREKDPIKEGVMISIEKDFRNWQKENDPFYNMFEELPWQAI